MSENPQKRPVKWLEYLGILCKRTALNGSAGCMGCLGMYCLFAMVVGIVITILNWMGRPVPGGTVGVTAYIAIGVYGGLGIGAMWSAKKLLRKSNKIESVQIISAQNADLLPPSEILVRPSDLPPSQQQAELLRAAQYGSKTPPEELLRAATNSQEDCLP